MRVSFTVDRGAAVRRGDENYGYVEVDVPLAGLTDKQRDTLSRLPEDGERVTALCVAVDFGGFDGAIAAIDKAGKFWVKAFRVPSLDRDIMWR